MPDAKAQKRRRDVEMRVETGYFPLFRIAEPGPGLGRGGAGGIVTSITRGYPVYVMRHLW